MISIFVKWKHILGLGGHIFFSSDKNHYPSKMCVFSFTLLTNLVHQPKAPDLKAVCPSNELFTCIGFEALHGEVSICIWFAVTPCVSTCQVEFVLRKLS